MRMPLRYQVSPVPPDGINCWLDSADRSTIPCLTQELSGAALRRTTTCNLFTAGPIERMLWSVAPLRAPRRRHEFFAGPNGYVHASSVQVGMTLPQPYG
jgi:hypothetical protein